MLRRNTDVPVRNSIFQNENIFMFIPEEKIPGFDDFERPVVIFRNAEGEFLNGFALAADEFITSFNSLRERCEMMGIYLVDGYGERL